MQQLHLPGWLILIPAVVSILGLLFMPIACVVLESMKNKKEKKEKKCSNS